VLNELVHTPESRQLFNGHIPRWPTICRVVYTVVHLIMHDCTGGLSTRYPTVNIMV